MIRYLSRRLQSDMYPLLSSGKNAIQLLLEALNNQNTSVQQLIRDMNRGDALGIKRAGSVFKKYRPYLRPISPEKGGWLFRWVHPMSDRRTFPMLWVYLPIIHDLAVEGRLRNIRECAQCGHWFYAYRPDPRFRFHKSACRDKYWRQTEQGKKTRAKSSKKYRQRLKKMKKNIEEARRAKAWRRSRR